MKLFRVEIYRKEETELLVDSYTTIRNRISILLNKFMVYMIDIHVVNKCCTCVAPKKKKG